MEKRAYPQDQYGSFMNDPHNVNKWMRSMQEVYAQAPILGWSKALDQVTSSWDDMEKNDFKNWISFYQENTHQKYKTANYIENGGSFIPNVDHLRAKLPGREPDMSPFSVSQSVTSAQEEEVQKTIIARKIQSLIGRLNSAERIATNPQVQLALKKFLHMSVDEWVSLLQKLKREIQLGPIRVTTATLIDDIIYRNANQIAFAGNKMAAKMLIKVAQVSLSTPSAQTPGGIAPMDPGNTPGAMQPLSPKDPGSAAPNGDMIGSTTGENPIAEFLSNINNTDISKVEDELEVDDVDDEASITVTAQAAPDFKNLPLSPNPAPIPDPKPRPPAPPVPPVSSLPEQPLEVSEDEFTNLSTGDPFDKALSSIRVNDIVARLEGIASMFKNRQIARQLSIIDLMMDKIGIAPFFPTLAEAMRSALESNQYCQSRVEDILAKLRGTISTPISEHLEGEVSGQNDAEEDELKSQLAQQEQAEQARKERRKMIQQKEEDESLSPQTPPPPINQELAGPAQVQSAPALRPIG